MSGVPGAGKDICEARHVKEITKGQGIATPFRVEGDEVVVPLDA